MEFDANLSSASPRVDPQTVGNEVNQEGQETPEGYEYEIDLSEDDR